MRPSVLLILLCVSIDFSNPMLPGSVRFDPGESIEAIPHAGAGLSGCPHLVSSRQPDRPQVLERRRVVRPRPVQGARTAGPGLPAVRLYRHQADPLTSTTSVEDH